MTDQKKQAMLGESAATRAVEPGEGNPTRIVRESRSFARCDMIGVADGTISLFLAC
jgi:hypothetical protein